MSEQAPSLKLSIVAPCYNEELVLEEFCRRAVGVGRSATEGSFEVVLVDDGSKDGTWDAICEQAKQYPEIVGIKLMRNHGHQLAATAGLSHARGERILLIDADLQDPPELLLMMMPVMNNGADVVYGQRQSRQGETWFKLATAKAFYRILPWLADTDIPRDTGDFRLMSRRVVDLLLAMPERDRFLRGMVSWVGGKQVALPYERHERFAGSTGYPLAKMISFATDAITSFSVKPLRLAAWLGFFSALVAAGMTVYSVWRWVAGDTVSGWASTMVVMTFFSAVQLLTLGILGEYIGRLVQQVKGRPLFMVDQIIGGGDAMPSHLHQPTYDEDESGQPSLATSRR